MRIANSFKERNSYSCMVATGANSYYQCMRGDELKEIRRQNLLLLRQRYTLEQIAERTGTNPTYLSQIANRVIQKNGKNPRSLSDPYAEKIEVGMGLPEGWMDQDHSPDVIEGTFEVVMPPPSLPLIPLMQEETLESLLRRLTDRLAQADPAVRQEVMQMTMRYIENPEAGSRIARAIEQLLGCDHADPAA